MSQTRRIRRELVYNGSIVDFYTDTMQIENGNIAKWDFVDHKGAAAVVPILPNGRILMVKQYRNALDSFTIEIPAGGLNGRDEPFIECAYRELEEETGYRCEDGKMKHLITLYTTVAFCNERIDIFVADYLVQSEQKLDEDEFVDVHSYELEELVSMIFKGEIVDAKTISAILAYKEKYKSY